MILFVKTNPVASTKILQLLVSEFSKERDTSTHENQLCRFILAATEKGGDTPFKIASEPNYFGMSLTKDVSVLLH